MRWLKWISKFAGPTSAPEACTPLDGETFECRLIDYLRGGRGLTPTVYSTARSDFWRLQYEGAFIEFGLVGPNRPASPEPGAVNWLLRAEGETAADFAERHLADHFRSDSMILVRRHNRIQWRSTDLLPTSSLARETDHIKPPESMGVLSAIRVLAESDDTTERRKAVAVWREINETDAVSVRPLLELIQGGNATVSRLAIEAIGRVGLAALVAKQSLIQIINARGDLEREAGWALKRVAPGLLRPLI